MKSLVLAEKPSVARDIARVLKCQKKINGAIEGTDYVVTWGLGHLVTLADPEDYDKKYKEWKMEDLPMMPKPFKLEVIRQTAGQYQAVKAQLFRKDVKDIIIATDAGREGELVARLILKKAECRKPIRRLWISSVTDKAIREGFAHLKDGREYDNLYHAAMCRAEADWLVGINATRALTCKYNAQLSCGRVQTPTLAMIFEDKIGISLCISGCIGALALILTGVISEKEALKSIDLKTIFLFGGTLSLAAALQNTGAGEMIAGTVMQALGDSPSPYILTFVVFMLCCVMTNFMSNTATTALMVPICLSISQGMGADPRAVLMACVIGGSCAYATPIGMPANTMVVGAGGYSFMDYVKAGLPLILIATVVSMIILPIAFPFFPA